MHEATAPRHPMLGATLTPTAEMYGTAKSLGLITH
jgi:hypothetical protein